MNNNEPENVVDPKLLELAVLHSLTSTVSYAVDTAMMTLLPLAGKAANSEVTLEEYDQALNTTTHALNIAFDMARAIEELIPFVDADLAHLSKEEKLQLKEATNAHPIIAEAIRKGKLTAKERIKEQSEDLLRELLGERAN